MYINLDILENINKYMFPLFCYKNKTGIRVIYCATTQKFFKKRVYSRFSYLEDSITNIIIPGNSETIGTIITEKTFNYNYYKYTGDYCDEILKPYIRCNIDFKISQENLDFLKSNKRIEKK